MTSFLVDLPDRPSAVDQLLRELRVGGSFFCRNELAAPWGYGFAGATCATMHIVIEGGCYLRVDGQEPVRLVLHDVVLLMRGTAHAFSSGPDTELQAFGLVTGVARELPVQAGPATVLICGGASIAKSAAEPLLSSLPDVICLSASQFPQDAGTIPTLIAMLGAELTRDADPLSSVTGRLFELVLIQTLRAWLAVSSAPEGSWLAAARDKRIGRALAAIHADPVGSWTLEGLADTAIMSRSAFAERFNALVGRTPMAYLTSLRMLMAQRWLRAGQETISSAAQRLGYESEPAFSRAFKRTVGVSPGTVRSRNMDAVPAFQSETDDQLSASVR